MSSAFPSTIGLDHGFQSTSLALTSNPLWGNTTILSTHTTCTEQNGITTATATPGSNWWAGGSWADAEAWCIVPAFNASLCTMGVVVRATVVGSVSPTFYVLELAPVAATDLQFSKFVNGTRTALGTAKTVHTFAAGDGFGASIVGSTLTSWYRNAGAANEWVRMDSFTDTSITAAGRIGIYARTVGAAATCQWAPFGGGPLPNDGLRPPAGQPFQFVGCRS